MKKLIISSVLFMLILSLSATMVKAASEFELATKLKAVGTKYGASAADFTKLDRYLNENDVTAEEADKIIAKVDEAVAVMEQAGVTDVKQLNDEKKNQLKTIANQAAAVLDLSLTYTNKTVEVYDKTGKKLDVITGSTPGSTSNGTPAASATSAGITQNGKLVYTGNNYNVLLILASVVGVALVSLFIGKKVVKA